MKFTKVEKITFSVLFSTFVFSLMILIVKISNLNYTNNLVKKEIDLIAKLTDKTPNVKTFYYNENESRNKLNLNKTNLASIKEIPCLNPSLAKKIFNFISKKEKISDLKELLEIKGMTHKKLKELDKYATVVGGHAGKASFGDKINLNYTNAKELSELQGLNLNIAEKIIEFRNSNGGFHSINELYVIPGLTSDKISSFIDKVEVK